ncbi:MAG: hypothetical protein EOO36_12065 [Cytophagaceae bacterium]|nr:MAG: hypothetical protein EOO36_12065 [Cytophagaceae bacterium]
MKVQKIINEHAAGRSYFGGVVLEVEYAPRAAGSSDLLLGFSSYVQHDETFHPAAQEGVEYFFSCYAPAHPGDLLVEVLGFHELAGDTTAAVIVYATVLALAEALHFPIAGLAFDPAAGTLRLPAPARVE